MAIFGGKKLKAFGLDISNVSIKVMALEKQNGGFVPKAFSDIPLANKVITNHIIVSEQKLAENIRAAVSSAGKINTKYVVASIPEAKSFVRIVRVPKMSEEEIEGAIPWELEQDIPVPVDQVYLDWQIIKEIEDKYEVLVTATPKDYVDSLVSALKLAHFLPVALELESQATARALIGREDLNNTVLILDIATMQSSFIIVENGVIEYTSSIPVAGSAFTESIARTLGIRTQEAEKLKREVGLTADNRRSNIRQAILPILDNIVDEIRNVAHFHEEHSTSKQAVNKILLCGGSAKLLGVADYISARLNLGSNNPMGKVFLGDAWVNIASPNLNKPLPMTVEDSLSYATVIGLALRGVSL